MGNSGQPLNLRNSTLPTLFQVMKKRPTPVSLPPRLTYLLSLRRRSPRSKKRMSFWAGANFLLTREQQSKLLVTITLFYSDKD